MNYFLRYPELFAGGAFKGIHHNREWSINGYNAKPSRFILKACKGAHYRIQINPCKICLLARPLEDLSIIELKYITKNIISKDSLDEAMMDIYVSSDSPRLDYIQYFIEYLISNLQYKAVPLWQGMTTKTFKFLLSRGVYPFPQEDFDGKRIKAHYEYG